MLNATMPARYAPPPAKTKTLKSPVDLGNLCRTIKNDRRDLSAFRQKRYLAVEQTAGENYGDNASRVEMPVNLMAIYIETILNGTVANQPRIMADTFEAEHEAAVSAWQDWANPELVAMDAASIFRRAIQDAIYWMGIVSVRLANPIDAEESGWGMKAGQPIMECIDPDDWVGDQGARTFDRMSYSGCRYRCPVKLANDLYKSAHKFEPDDRTDYNYGGDPRIDEIGRTPGWREEVEDHTTIWEIWLPKHKQIMLLRDSGGVPDETHGPVAVKPWIGPARGPYHYLGLDFPAGNLNPNGPANRLVVLNSNFNSAWRKLLRQTRDYKKYTAYRGTAAKDAERVKSARDGEMVNVDCDPNDIQERESGGAGNAVWAMAQAMQQAFNFMGGNLAILSGRSAQSKTATQDKLLNENASASLASVQDKAYAFMQKCLDSWKWFTWNHPTKVMHSIWQSESMPDLRVPRQLGPWNSKLPLKRNGPMPKINLDIYSLARQTPQSRLAFQNAVLQGMLPLLPFAEKQGVQFDAQAWLDEQAKLGNEPGVKRMFRYAEPPAAVQGNGDTGAGGKPANTTRTYQRYGAGEDSEAAEGAALNEQFNELQAGNMNPNSEV